MSGLASARLVLVAGFELAIAFAELATESTPVSAFALILAQVVRSYSGAERAPFE